MSEDAADQRQYSRLMELADEFRRELSAAVQAMEAARPVLENDELCGWFEAKENLLPGLVLCRQGSVAATMALMRIWAPSGDSFSAQKLAAEANRCGRGSPQLVALNAAMRRNARFLDALKRLERWRSKRIAHRESDYINNPPLVEDEAHQADFDCVVEHSLNIMDALRTLFPCAALPDVRLAQKVWASNARQFWSGVLKPYPELLSLLPLLQRGRSSG